MSTKISGLTAYTTPIATDILPIVDISNSITKKITLADLFKAPTFQTSLTGPLLIGGSTTTSTLTYKTTTGVGTTGADHIWVVGNDGATELMRGTNAGRLGVGTGSTVSAKVHVISTTEVLRLGYDVSNYMSVTVASNGTSTFNLVGTNAEIVFSQATNFSSSVRVGTVGLYLDGSINVLNKANNGFLALANRNTAGSEVVYDLAYIGTIDNTGNAGFGVAVSSSARVKIGASTTALSQINLPTGSAPSAPVDGDIWREDNTNTGLKIRVNGVTKTITLA